MRSYRTEILIPPDRSILLQLPDGMDQGWATVTVLCHESAPPDAPESDPDRQDIEWWDEFDGGEHEAPGTDV